MSINETTAETGSEPTESTRWRPSVFVTPRVLNLQERFRTGSSEARAVLAQLRTAAAGEPGTAWEISDYLLPERTNSPSAMRSDSSVTDSADFAETAIHIAMTSYAALQQAQDKPMHVQGRSLGSAVRMLGAHPDGTMDRSKVWGRLSKLARAESVAGLRWQLRGLISLLRRAGIGLDIGTLADDLYFWQFPSSQANVQRSWSRAFYNVDRSENSDNTGSPATPPSN